MDFRNQLLPFLSGIIVSSIFGFSFVFTAGALQYVNPIQLLAFRFGIAAIALTLVILLFRIKINYQGKKIAPLLWLGLFQPIAYFIFETIGIKLTSSLEAGMVIGSIPVVVTGLAAVFLHEKPSPKQLAAILISVSGVFFIVLMSGGGGNSHLSGILALLGAVIAAGIYNIMSRKSSIHFSPVEITLLMMWAGAIFFNIIGLGQAVATHTVSSYFAPLGNVHVQAALLYLGILSSIMAFFLVNFMLSKLPASQSAVFNNLTTVVSIFAGVFVRHEPLQWYHIAGTCAILLGVWGANYFSSISVLRDEQVTGV